MLVQGSHFKDIEVLVGHNTNEGLSLVNPSFQNSTDSGTEELFEELIRAQFPSISSDMVQYIVHSLYTPVYAAARATLMLWGGYPNTSATRS